VVTYTLPLFAILFTIGIFEVIKKRKFLILIPAVLLALEFYSAIKLNRRFIAERIVVDKSLVSLREVHKLKSLNEPIYTEQSLTGLMSYWKQIWTNYFLYPLPTYTPLNFDSTKDKVPDGSLVLLSKTRSGYNPLKLLLTDVIWENEYYRLGRLCNSDECLTKMGREFSGLDIGRSEYEDTLLGSGWSANEGDYRWATSKKSTLRLVTKEISPSSIVVVATSLRGPQVLSVFIDKEYIGAIEIKPEWREYKLSLNNPLVPGVHQVTLSHSNSYRPIDIGLSLDTRELYVNYKKIGFE
jgi:hypothetical protein